MRQGWSTSESTEAGTSEWIFSRPALQKIAALKYGFLTPFPQGGILFILVIVHSMTKHTGNRVKQKMAIPIQMENVRFNKDVYVK